MDPARRHAPRPGVGGPRWLFGRLGHALVGGYSSTRRLAVIVAPSVRTWAATAVARARVSGARAVPSAFARDSKVGTGPSCAAPMRSVTDAVALPVAHDLAEQTAIVRLARVLGFRQTRGQDPHQLRRRRRPPPWTAHSPGGASPSSATGRGGGRRPSPTRRRGPRRPRRPVGRWRARSRRRGWRGYACDRGERGVHEAESRLSCQPPRCGQPLVAALDWDLIGR